MVKTQGNLITIDTISEVVARLYYESYDLWMKTGRTLRTKSLEDDEKVEKVLGMLSNHEKQFEWKFLNILKDHLSRAASSLDSIITAAKKGNLDAKRLEECAHSIKLIGHICSNMYEEEQADMLKDRALLAKIAPLKRQVIRKQKAVNKQLEGIRRKHLEEAQKLEKEAAEKKKKAKEVRKAQR